MSKNRLKNIQGLSTYKLFTDKKYHHFIDDIIDLYKNDIITNIKTANNLADKFSSRGKGIESAKTQLVKIKKVVDAKKTIDEVINFNPIYSEGKPQKKSRTERIAKTLDAISNTNETFEDIVKNQKMFRKQAINGIFGERTVHTNISYEYIKTAENILKRNLTDMFIHENKEFNMYGCFSIQYIMIKLHADGKQEEIKLYYHAKYQEILKSPNQISEYVSNQFPEFYTQLEEQFYQSNLKFKCVSMLTIQTSKAKKTRAGSYIELPEEIAKKRACINIKNTDNKCIVWSIIASKNSSALEKAKNYRTSVLEPYIKDCIEPENQVYPINIQTDIVKFERLNNLKINVYEFNKKSKKIDVIYNNRSRNENVLNLLLITKDDISHIVWIKDLSKLLRIDSNHEKRFWCSQCLSKSYSTQEMLNKHLELCNKHEAIATVYPKKSVEGEKKPEDKVSFYNYGNKFKHPFSIYMDFEATLEKCNSKEEDNIEVDEKTQKYQKHIANSCGYKFNCIHDEYSEPVKIINNADENKLLEEVIIDIERLALKAYKLTQQNRSKYDLSSKEYELHRSTKVCNECKCKFTETNKKVVHHDHISSKYISTLCNTCNLQYVYKKFIPVFIHNLKGYDAHFLVPALNSYGFKQDSTENISCIPCNEEKYISFSKKIIVDTYIKNKKQYNVWYEIRFVDTLAFMASSIDKLTENLKAGCKTDNELKLAFKNSSKHFNNSDLKFKAMISKGVYPYEYIDSYEKLYEKQLPPKEKFYSVLNDTNIKDSEYETAKNVWSLFDCKTMLDYHNLYLTSDVLLLADIFEAFKEVCYKIYDLDATYYYTAPGLSWDSFLKHTNEVYLNKFNKKFEIELITDADMYLFFESSIRGGLSQISKRYAKANNKYMSDYNESIQESYILYLDANNLYGAGMISYLPQSDFQWNNEIWTDDKVLKLSDTGDFGYLFDVDIHYPEKLHDLHNGYALASQNMIITNDLLNDWQIKDRKENKIEKLCTSFKDKKNYGINYRLLKLYIELGLEIKYNRVLQFKQSNYMESYIMKNTNERINAKNDFEKDFYKLMNNAVYGKTMENVRNRINFKLISSEEQALNLRNERQRYTIFNENLVGVHMCKKEVKLNKPIFIGQTVLDESKLVMQNFHYNFMLKKIERKNIDLLFTDTDSLCYHIKNVDPYKIMKENKDYFDLSAFPKTHELYDPKNKKVIGKFKDEAVDGPFHVITEFVGLRSKLYAYLTDDNKEHKKCKGVKKSVVDKQITLNDYNHTLNTKESKTVQQNVFRSYKHQLFTEKVTKVALSANDDKTFILNNNVECLTFGHYKINQIKKHVI